MSEADYLTFDLAISAVGEGTFQARVIASPVGQASTDFQWPTDSVGIFDITNQSLPPGSEEAQAFGTELYNAVFGGDVGTCLMRSIDEGQRLDRGVSIRLRTGDAPALANLPWELLYLPSKNRFLDVSTDTAIVRYIELPERIRPLAVSGPLRILVVLANPSDSVILDVEREWELLSGALAGLTQQQTVVVERLLSPTLAELQDRLRGEDVHVLHFVGHGSFIDDRGVVYFEDEDGRSREVAANQLGAILHDHDPLRLVVLNSCEGADTSQFDPFSGTATNLVSQGIPAVVAMQYQITDGAAIEFCREFYEAVADGYPFGAAIGEARKRMFAVADLAEWATPVLYMRSEDGRVFDVSKPAGDASKPSTADSESTTADPGLTADPGPARDRRPMMLAAAALIIVAGFVAILVVTGGGEDGEKPPAGPDATAEEITLAEIEIISGPFVNGITTDSFHFNYSTNNVCGTGSFTVARKSDGRIINSFEGENICYGPLHGGFALADHDTFGGFNLDPGTTYVVNVRVQGTEADGGPLPSGGGSDTAQFEVTTSTG